MNKELITSLYTKYRIIIYPVLVGVASAILIILVIWPQTVGYFKDRENVAVLGEKQKVLQVKASELETLDDSELKHKLAALIAALPSDEDFPGTIGAVQRLGIQSGVVLSSVQIGQQKKSGTGEVSNYSVSLEILAPLAAINEFITSAEKSGRVMKVSSIELGSLRTSDNVSATITLEIYYSSAKEVTGSMDNPLPKITSDEEVVIATLASSLPNVVDPSAPVALPQGKVNPFE